MARDTSEPPFPSWYKNGGGGIYLQRMHIRHAVTLMIVRRKKEGGRKDGRPRKVKRPRKTDGQGKKEAAEGKRATFRQLPEWPRINARTQPSMVATISSPRACVSESDGIDGAFAESPAPRNAVSSSRLL